MKKNTTYASATLACGLLSWVPLLNIAIAPLAILFGALSLYKIIKHPKKYDGMIRTCIGLAIGLMWLAFSVIAFYNQGFDLFIRQ